MAKQQFNSEHKSVYKDFEINTGKLANGEKCFEAWSDKREMGFFRPTLELLYGAIDFYCSTNTLFVKETIASPKFMDCGDCDGCGWYEGGPTLQTKCEKCNGTGQIQLQ